MSSTLRRMFVAAAAGLLLTASASAADNLLVNGSFEVGPSFAETFINLPGGTTSITGWTVGGFRIDYCKATCWTAADGSFSIDLDGSGTGPLAGAISQSFATNAGQQYRVSFEMSGNISGLPLVKQARVSAGDTVQDFTFATGAIIPFVPPMTITYEPHAFTFTATSSTTTLTFESQTALSETLPGFGAVIDDVRVESLAPWTDLGFALAGATGKPQLEGSGTLEAGSPGSLVLSNAAPSQPALFVLALGVAPLPFKCGTLVPGPAPFTLLLTTSPAGEIPIAWTSWAAGASGLDMVVQYAIKDPGAICGVSLSNAVRGDIP